MNIYLNCIAAQLDIYGKGSTITEVLWDSCQVAVKQWTFFSLFFFYTSVGFDGTDLAQGHISLLLGRIMMNIWGAINLGQVCVKQAVCVLCHATFPPGARWRLDSTRSGGKVRDHYGPLISESDNTADIHENHFKLSLSSFKNGTSINILLKHIIILCSTQIIRFVWVDLKQGI